MHNSQPFQSAAVLCAFHCSSSSCRSPYSCELPYRPPWSLHNCVCVTLSLYAEGFSLPSSAEGRPLRRRGLCRPYKQRQNSCIYRIGFHSENVLWHFKNMAHISQSCTVSLTRSTYSGLTEAWLNEVLLFSSRGFFLGIVFSSTST